MMILYGCGSFQPLQRVQTWALERLISLNCVSGDVRWAIVALALRSFAAMWGFGRRQFALLVRKASGRAGQGECLAADMIDADSMVAAGGG